MKKRAMTSEKASRVKRKGHEDAREFAKLLGIGKTCGEIEMRNDSDVHYREVKFWLDKKLTFALLKAKIHNYRNFNDRIILYGKAISKLNR